ncbi:hypothetical protein PPYR_06647 [Photinus pyralis]|uniref:Major facilitator superfamily (MFS) profile domain-containing protein n=1 Tax=Photinus pyralis TaxID=7054 RepID=A0A5N4AN66_PHOPY|nr:hypothetical protein PPYR_06647 [Photinus pyralis]
MIAHYAHYIQCALGSLLTICCGFNYAWTSPYLPILLSEDSPISMSAEESSWIGTIYLLGGLCGSLLLSAVGHLIGRKTILIWTCLPVCASLALIAFAKTLFQLLIGRIIAGVSLGLAFSTLQIYLSEITDREVRGLLCSTVSVMTYVGMMVVNVIGTYMSIKISSLVCLTVPVLIFIGFISMPEPPNYLLMKGRREEARQCLVSLKGSDQVDHNLHAIIKVIDQERLNKTPFTSMFKKIHRRKLLTLLGLRVAQQFSGATAFNLYTQTVLQEAGDSISPLRGTVILYTTQIVFSGISSLLVDKLGRRPLLITSALGTICVLLAGGSFFFVRDVVEMDTSHASYMPALILITFMLSYGLGLQTLPNFSATKLFPTNLKPYACTLGDVVFYTFGVIVSEYFQFTKDNFGMFVPFWSFAICCSIGLVIVVIFMPETKNKTLEDIQIELNH